MRTFAMTAAGALLIAGSAFAGPLANMPVTGNGSGTAYTAEPWSPGMHIDARRTFTLEDCKLLSGETYLNCEKQVRTGRNNPMVTLQDMGEVPMTIDGVTDPLRSGDNGSESNGGGF